jgi:hypothetical protein
MVGERALPTLRRAYAIDPYLSPTPVVFDRCVPGKEIKPFGSLPYLQEWAVIEKTVSWIWRVLPLNKVVKPPV